MQIEKCKLQNDSAGRAVDSGTWQRIPREFVKRVVTLESPGSHQRPFRLKGGNRTAQGNALGSQTNIQASP
jgi:hypothetical protein